MGALEDLLPTFCIRTADTEVVVGNSSDSSNVFLLGPFYFLSLLDSTVDSFLTGMMPTESSNGINSIGSSLLVNDVKLCVN